MEQLRNAMPGETGDSQENPPTSGIVRYYSLIRKPVSDSAGNRTRFTQEGAYKISVIGLCGAPRDGNLWSNACALRDLPSSYVRRVAARLCADARAWWVVERPGEVLHSMCHAVWYSGGRRGVLLQGLRQVVFGTPVTTPRSEWLRTGLVFREPDQDLAFGLKAARNGTRGLLSVVQAHILKHLLFQKDCPASPDMYVQSVGHGQQGEVGGGMCSVECACRLLKPSRSRQLEALWTSLSDILWRVGEKSCSKVCLPQDEPHVPHSHKYFQDGLTEKLHIFEFANYDDLLIFIKRYIFLFVEENGPGTLLLLYCAVLTRGCGKVKLDLGNDKCFLVTAAEEGSQCVVTLLLTGRATPYLHNGVVYVGDEDHYALPQFGVLARSEVGFLLWEEGNDGKMDESRQPGSRLKTPSMPVWVCCCLGHYGVLFNTNSELLRNYQAERRCAYQPPLSGRLPLLLTSTGGSSVFVNNTGNVVSKLIVSESLAVIFPLKSVSNGKWPGCCDRGLQLVTLVVCVPALVHGGRRRRVAVILHSEVGYSRLTSIPPKWLPGKRLCRSVDRVVGTAGAQQLERASPTEENRVRSTVVSLSGFRSWE
ncbi:hypothetical protein PR048_027396 [Dryococelus australis]|uniref:Ubiquitin carboxyl-terminal hydrolase MINDY n=1 Tax=Dryococelus australis TaxID=614101 RepID=A0ABQ9GGE9_9NEOP|nr:hypothetical protein PR048_027396 [Dryococelus australis]